MNACYGVLRVVHAEEETTQKPPATGEPDRLGAWDLPGYTGNAAGLPDPLYPLTEATTTLGRGLNNHVVLMDPTVSREHARLIWRDGEWLIENLSPHNQLFANKVSIAPSSQQEIRPGSILVLGQTTLQLLAPLNEPVLALSEAHEQTSQASSSLQQARQTGEFYISPEARAKSAEGRMLALLATSEKQPGRFIGMSPGVTMQFAWRERVDRGRFWALGTIALVVFGVLLAIGCAYLTFLKNAQLSADVISHGGLSN
ncbi:MAG TPA: FHA domain-containing protein, partial [Ktedonobacterales bacterium]|nr:FHA domain-containing protein [Ktedonobacterales bacterium]